jgi:alanyl-tRNA synthetase
VTSGEVISNAEVTTAVDPQWRLGACQAHSATHVVHAALRQVLGPDALQSGSFNKPGYMRLDFAWGEALSDATKSEIEEVSNLAIRADLAVSAQFMTLPQAQKFGAIALFGETYDEQVRVVQVGGPWSRELCGGTHVSRSSQIGLVSVTGESSVGSGSRRIEALVGMTALRALGEDRNLVRRLASTLKASNQDLEARITDALAELKSLQRLQQEVELARIQSLVPQLVAEATRQGSAVVLAKVLPGQVEADALRSLTMSVRAELGEQALVVIGAAAADKASVMIAVGSNLVSSGIRAGEIAKLAAAELGGGGGGKPDFAQAGGPNLSALAKAVSAASSVL